MSVEGMPASPKDRLEGAREQLRLAREQLDEADDGDLQERLYRVVRVQAVTDALAATDAALDIVRSEKAAIEAAEEARQ